MCPPSLQVLVLPTLQRCGYGRALVAAAYHLARERDAIDLTVSGSGLGLLWLANGQMVCHLICECHGQHQGVCQVLFPRE